jgi:HPt (histidine-containing phosphotransfer) domain-containing protein
VQRLRGAEQEMDLTVALAHVGGDPQFLAELASVFLQDYPRLLNSARESIRQGDSLTLEREAHTLKGRLAFFGIPALRDKALDLEKMGRSRDLTGAGQKLAEIEGDMEEVLREFEALAREQKP